MTAAEFCVVGRRPATGDAYRLAAGHRWPRPQVALSPMMSEVTAQRYALEATEASGLDFGEANPA